MKNQLIAPNFNYCLVLSAVDCDGNGDSELDLELDGDGDASGDGDCFTC